MEFAYNNSFQATIGMAPFEALYGKCCRSPICWNEVGEQRLMGPELVRQMKLCRRLEHVCKQRSIDRKVMLM